jgi:hypothetical protein
MGSLLFLFVLNMVVLKETNLFVSFCTAINVLIFAVVYVHISSPYTNNGNVVTSKLPYFPLLRHFNIPKAGITAW